MFNIINSLKGIIEPVANLVDKLTFSEEEKANIRTSLIKTQNEINLIALNAQREYTLAYQKILLVDAQSDDKWQRRWRPGLSLAFGIIVVLVSLTSILHAYIPSIQEVALDENIWEIILAMLGITSLTRGVEKSVKSYKNGNTKEKL